MCICICGGLKMSVLAVFRRRKAYGIGPSGTIGLQAHPRSGGSILPGQYWRKGHNPTGNCVTPQATSMEMPVRGVVAWAAQIQLWTSRINFAFKIRVSWRLPAAAMPSLMASNKNEVPSASGHACKFRRASLTDTSAFLHAFDYQ